MLSAVEEVVGEPQLLETPEKARSKQCDQQAGGAPRPGQVGRWEHAGLLLGVLIPVHRYALIDACMHCGVCKEPVAGYMQQAA